MSTRPDYILPRNYLDNNRINLQHYLWIELFRYHIHPKISTQAPDLQVADVGTGTAVWLTDLATRLPKSVQFHGLDVSFDAAPLPEMLPENVALQRLDLREEPPESLKGAYNIIHLRYLLFVLGNDDIKPVLTRLISMLKPGGYLQWGEPDAASLRFQKTHPEDKDDAMRRLAALSQGQDARLSPTWIAKLPQYFSECGLEDVEADVRESPPHLELAMHECVMAVHELIARNSQNEKVVQGLQELMPEVARETRAGAYWAFTRWTVIGRKPIA